MRKLKPPPSLPLTLLYFWIFSSVPRLWYLAGSEARSYGAWESVRLLFTGFCRDGVLILSALIALFFLLPYIDRASVRAQKRIQRFVALILTALAVLMMGNIEFFRYFGSNTTLTHLTFISETEVMIPSFSTVFPPLKVALMLAFIPLCFFIACTESAPRALDRSFKSRGNLAVMIALLAFCLWVNAGTGIKDIVKRNLSDNYLLSVAQNFIVGDDVSGKIAEPIETILDTLPLKDPTRKEPDWYHFDPKFPLAKATAYDLCAMGKWDKLQCDTDHDGDHVPLKNDCNDADPAIHPGAADIPGNGIDEDCSGLDADPPNVIFIHWEGARAVNVGSVGYSESCTPNFDRLAKKGLLFRNAYANGVQTRWSLTSVYNSILPRLSTKWIFQHNPELNLLAFPKILRDRGYHTIYIHSGDIGFSGFRPRFSQWFETMLDRNVEPLQSMPHIGWGPTDKDLLNFAFDYLKTRKDRRPFYVTIATLSLHHPFLLPDKRFEKRPHKDQINKVPNILRYSDEHVGNFVDKVLSDPQFKNTVILIAADHGLNAYTPHATGAQSTLWEDLVWVPMLLIGDKWNVKPGTNDEVRQLADIGPTVLDRLGIQTADHFIGHSLLRRFDGREPKVFFGNANGGISAGLRIGKYKYFVSMKTKNQHLFDVSVDRPEKNDLGDDPAYADLCKTFYRMVADVEIQNTRLIKENRIWDPHDAVKR